ncbi:hypothetical protein DPMN_096215 [Dreissena polymorpha]|uniref:Uncharacterized protein n=1 Tax=Dreissena polymorpha TaxID=45954 RepID=A0A9D4L9C2_DREPO|nr:hypothetical protein DPMN_096215 [Dreissena polymorpha]
MKSAKALPRYGSGHKSVGRTDSRTDGQRQNNIPTPLAGDNKQEHRLAGADRSSIFSLKVKGLSISITKEGGVE